MLTERLQILVTPDQKNRLKERAAEEHKPVGQLVREAIDLRYPRKSTREERMRAVEEIKAMRVPGPLPDAEELDRLYEKGIDDRMGRAGVKLED